MELKEQFFVARRVKRVIESCDTIEQLEGARNYLELFFKAFSKPTGTFLDSFTVQADQSTVKLYNNLWIIWKEKRQTFLS